MNAYDFCIFFNYLPEWVAMRDHSHLFDQTVVSKDSKLKNRYHWLLRGKTAVTQVECLSWTYAHQILQATATISRGFNALSCTGSCCLLSNQKWRREIKKKEGRGNTIIVPLLSIQYFSKANQRHNVVSCRPRTLLKVWNFESHTSMSFILVHQCWHGSQTFKNDRFVIHPNPNYSWILTDLSQSFVWRCSMAISVMVTCFRASPHLSLSHTEQTDGRKPGSWAGLKHAEPWQDRGAAQSVQSRTSD